MTREELDGPPPEVAVAAPPSEGVWRVRSEGAGSRTLGTVISSGGGRGWRAEVHRRLLLLSEHLARRPMGALAPLVGVVLVVEFGQYWPEAIRGSHAIGEVVRNLAYALIGALIFNWIIVELPERRRRRAAYEYNKMAMELLVTVGAASIAEYRHLHPGGPAALDAWRRESVGDCARAIVAANPLYFGPERARFLENIIRGVRTALDGMKSAQLLLDADVAHALALFPSDVGLNQLQVARDNRGHVPPERDAHIVWELLEGGRRLYKALRRSVPEMSLNLGQSVSDGTVVEASEADLLRPGDLK